MEKSCLVCNSLFKTYPSKVKIGRGKYCSKACSDSVTLIKKGQHISPQTEIKKGQVIGKVKGWRLCGRRKNYKAIYINGKYIREHRLVVEQYLGRKLESWEEVHHIDGNGLNNDISNLLILSKSDHLRLEHQNGRYRNHLKNLKRGWSTSS